MDHSQLSSPFLNTLSLFLALPILHVSYYRTQEPSDLIGCPVCSCLFTSMADPLPCACGEANTTWYDHEVCQLFISWLGCSRQERGNSFLAPKDQYFLPGPFLDCFYCCSAAPQVGNQPLTQGSLPQQELEQSFMQRTK